MPDQVVDEKKPTHTDIYSYPTVKEPHTGSITIGDLHGNSVKLLYFLLRHDLVQFKEGNDPTVLYQRFVDLYQNSASADLETLAKIPKELNDIIQELQVVNKNTLVRLIGDELADRGNNDYLTLKLLGFLHDNDVKVNITLSNHSTDFISSYESNQFDNEGNVSDSQKPSYINFKQLYDKGIISKDEIDSLVNKAYKPTLKVLDYTLTGGGITLFTHAPVRFDSIETLAKGLNVPYSDVTPQALAVTIERINDAFAEKVKANEVNTLCPTKEKGNIGKLETLSKKETNAYPVLYAIWNRWGKDKDTADARPNTIRNYSITYVHGHDDYKSKYEHVINLDNALGKTNAKQENEKINVAEKLIKEEEVSGLREDFATEIIRKYTATAGLDSMVKAQRRVQKVPGYVFDLDWADKVTSEDNYRVINAANDYLAGQVDLITNSTDAKTVINQKVEILSAIKTMEELQEQEAAKKEAAKKEAAKKEAPKEKVADVVQALKLTAAAAEKGIKLDVDTAMMAVAIAKDPTREYYKEAKAYIEAIEALKNSELLFEGRPDYQEFKRCKDYMDAKNFLNSVKYIVLPLEQRILTPQEKFEAYAVTSTPEYLKGKVEHREHHTVVPVSEELKDKYGSNLSGDGLKRAIINNFKESIKGIKNASDYEAFKNSDITKKEYEILKTPQGRFTEKTGLKTDSQKAVEMIFSQKEKDLQIPDRFHLFKASFNENIHNNQNIPIDIQQKYKCLSVEDQFKGLSGDRLKKIILDDLRETVSGIKDPEELDRLLESYKNSESYKILAQGQGIWTRLTKKMGGEIMKTDSENEVEAIFNNQMNDIKAKVAMP